MPRNEHEKDLFSDGGVSASTHPIMEGKEGSSCLVGRSHGVASLSGTELQYLVDDGAGLGRGIGRDCKTAASVICEWS